MKIIGVIWYEETIAKIYRKHRVKQYEVEEVFELRPKFRFVEKGYRKNENVYAALGRTKAGRYCRFKQ